METRPFVTHVNSPVFDETEEDSMGGSSVEEEVNEFDTALRLELLAWAALLEL